MNLTTAAVVKGAATEHAPPVEGAALSADFIPGRESWHSSERTTIVADQPSLNDAPFLGPNHYTGKSRKEKRG